MSHTPLLSVLIPTYQYVRYLPEAIESVLDQDFSDMEIIISDDASTDESPQLLRHYVSLDSRIRAVVQPRNLGMVENWNWCLGQAKGRYIRFLFGDDRLSRPDALRRQVLALEDNPGAVMAVSARTLIDEQSRRIGLWDDLGWEGLHRGNEVGKQCLLETKNLIGEPSAVMFRTLARGNEVFDRRYRQIVDLEFWLKLLSRGDLVYSKRSLCEFRRHGLQATAANSKLGLGFSEYAVLLRTHMPHFVPENLALGDRDRRYLFSVLHYARKVRSRSKAAADLIELLSRRMSPADYAAHWLRFSFLRPCVNLRLSLHKRLYRRRLEWSFGGGWKWGPLLRQEKRYSSHAAEAIESRLQARTL